VQAFAYGDLAEEMAVINRAFIDVMTEGDQDGRAFTFPIPTYNITKDFDWEGANTDALFGMTAKYGLPYFQNFVNSDLDPHMIRSMCCRLQLDLTELLKRGNGLFGSAEQTGSIGVVTVNCARLGFVHSGDEDAVIARLDELLEIARDSLVAKRAVIAHHLDGGLFPYTQRYLGTLDNHFSTIGVNGLNEYVRNFTRDADDITTARHEPGDAPARPRPRAHGRVPGADRAHVQPRGDARRGTTYRFAKEDIARFPASATPAPPTTRTTRTRRSCPSATRATRSSPCRCRRRCSEVHRRNGAAPLHGRSDAVRRGRRELVRRSLSRFRLPYITVTPTFSICPRHGYRSGHHEQCPTAAPRARCGPA
jgi:ribonucleoside-triphosphate reductase